MEWLAYDRGLNLAAQNMAFDSEMLEKVSETKKPSLHFYEFSEKSATYGYFIKPFELLSEQTLNELNVDIAKRPTGGGFLLHGQDFTFSIAIPETHGFYSQNPLESYNKINGLVLDSLKKITKKSALELFAKEDEALKFFKNFCMAKPTKFDLFFDGRKIGGAAERRVKFGMLHQATINILPPWMDWHHRVFEDETLKKAIQTNSSSLFLSLTPKDRLEFKTLLKETLKEAFFNS
ncbi:lipoyl protein ligase domain-containing protein [Criblamydia sequanensis]|uniref:Lipoate-protein ligase A n=1 Tax=Candidatus Criblamydia sequanensis CRIB-18 TaxID=1437425 RepID=A0A090CXQ4_9BACT|nr:hypothetical protein [Criblamydia sequanensis]CDR32862.1 putative lipoate-protein ligase A [Criblamydia sequanensis CRIB-18]